MKRLVVLGLALVAAACAPQSPPAATTAPPPVLAAAPPPPPPPPMTRASFDGAYSGMMEQGAIGLNSNESTSPHCQVRRPISMSIRQNYVTIAYNDYKRHTIHYRGRVEPSGTINVSHLNGDGTRSIFTLQIGNTGVSGEMQRGHCDYRIEMTRT